MQIEIINYVILKVNEKKLKLNVHLCYTIFSKMIIYIIYEVWKELKEKWTRISDQ